MVKRSPLFWLILIQWVVALEWLHSGWNKLASADYMAKIGDTIGFFASTNPHQGMRDFLTQAAQPNAAFFGELVRWSELGIALVLLVGGWLALSGRHKLPWVRWAMLVGLLVAILMNATFYLAAGWTGASTSGINLVMGVIEVILLAFYLGDFETKTKKPARKKR